MKYTNYKTLDKFVRAVKESSRENTLVVGVRAKQISRDPSDGSRRYNIYCEFNRGYDTARLIYDNVLIESDSELKEWKTNKCREIYSKLKEIEIKSYITAEELLITGSSD